MSLRKDSASGNYVGYFRRKDMKPLHLSMRTKRLSEAKERHDAITQAVREGRAELIAQIRAGSVSVERVAAMVRQREPLVAVVPDAAIVAPAAEQPSPWGTVDAMVDRYLEWLTLHPNRSDRTPVIAKFQLQRFTNFLFWLMRIGDHPFDQVPSEAIQAYQRAMIDGGTPPNTITTSMSRVGALWTWAIDQEPRLAREARRPERALFSPVVSELVYREVHRRDRVLTAPEVERLLAATPEPLLFPVACGLYAGLRIGETLHLRPTLDVDIHEGTITIRKQSEWRPKTKRSERMVPMAPALRAIAVKHVVRYASDLWMLPSSAMAGEPMTENGFRPQFEVIVKRAGLVYGRSDPQGVVYHTLRHTFASHAVMRGVDLYTVAKLLGDSVTTVESTHADLSPDHKRKAVALLAGAFDFSGNATARDTEIEVEQ